MRPTIRRSQDGVSSHVDIAGNEKADKTANIATRTILNPKITDIPVNDIYSIAKLVGLY